MSISTRITSAALFAAGRKDPVLRSSRRNKCRCSRIRGARAAEPATGVVNEIGGAGRW
jgi:hypothetical protein